MEKKILICEDDEVLSSMIKFKLGKDRLGDIINVNNGKDAKEAIEQNDFSLIISDIHMPFISGMQLLEHVREFQKKNTSFIILSAEGLESTVLEAFDLGVTDFLTKPFSPGELSMRVKRLLHAA
ncbi:response regulator transcription factor [Ekhidna sp.]|uniref:response regulator transcription factor n=1 Tax=Ekhidna sp. TaxID=2608089 RepID=UPI00329796D7